VLPLAVTSDWNVPVPQPLPVPLPVPTWTICHCWLAPSRSPYWPTIAPSVVCQLQTSTTLPLCRLTNRTWPPAESLRVNC
jgi:hypothetical protein